MKTQGTLYHKSGCFQPCILTLGTFFAPLHYQVSSRLNFTRHFFQPGRGNPSCKEKFRCLFHGILLVQLILSRIGTFHNYSENSRFIQYKVFLHKDVKATLLSSSFICWLFYISHFLGV